jgi:hypothetical protein
MIEITLKLGRGSIKYQDSRLENIHKFSSIYGALPDKCDNCSSDNLFLNYKAPKGNDYYSIACKDCKAELNLHQKKDGGFYVVAGEKMTIYKGKQENNNQDQGEQKSNSLPF